MAKLSKDKKNKRRNYYPGPPHICRNCGRPSEGGHFMPPSLGEPGFFVCEAGAPRVVAQPTLFDSLYTQDCGVSREHLERLLVEDIPTGVRPKEGTGPALLDALKVGAAKGEDVG